MLDAEGGHILPGFIDAHCHLGLFGDALGFEADDGNESTDPCTPQLRAVDGVNPLDRGFREARPAHISLGRPRTGRSFFIYSSSVYWSTRATSRSR